MAAPPDPKVGVDTGIMEEPMLRVYMMYKADSEAFPDEVPGRWVGEGTWPSSRTQSSSLYFRCWRPPLAAAEISRAD